MAKLISLWAQVVWVLTEAMPWCIPKGVRGFPKEMPFYLDLEKEMWSHYAWRRKGAFHAKGGIQGQDPYFFTCGWNSHVPFMSEESSPASVLWVCWGQHLAEITWENLPGNNVLYSACSPRVLERWEQGTESRGAEEQAEAQRGKTSVSPGDSAQLCLWPWMTPGKSCPNPALLLPWKTGASNQMFTFRLVTCI